MLINDVHRHLEQVPRKMHFRGYGRSRRVEKQNGSTRNKIFASNTFKTYLYWNRRFARWIDDKGLEVKNTDDLKIYSHMFLDEACNSNSAKGKPYSPSTIKTIQAALNKVCGLKPGDKYYFSDAPQRHRSEITRSRNPEANKRLEKKWGCMMDAFRGIGCRRNVAEHMQGRDLYYRSRVYTEFRELMKKETLTKDESALLRALKETIEYFPYDDYFVLHRKDKGGRWRIAPIIGPHKDEIVEMFKKTPDTELVWPSIPKNMDIHALRADYANRMYRIYARPTKTITNKREIYHCRKDKKGMKLDKPAMDIAAISLGHGSGRTVFADHYLRDSMEE